MDRAADRSLSVGALLDILERTDPARARELSLLLQSDVDERWRYYEQLAAMQRTVPHGGAVDPGVVQDVENDAGYRYDGEASA